MKGKLQEHIKESVEKHGKEKTIEALTVLGLVADASFGCPVCPADFICNPDTGRCIKDL